MKNFQYAIFDVDGTLLDSTHLWDGVAEEHLKSLGKEVDEDLDSIINTMGYIASTEYVIKKYELTIDFAGLVSEYNNIAKKRYMHVKLKTGVRELLEKLKNDGVTICACSDSTESLIVPALEKHNLFEYLDFFLSSQSHNTSKDEPKIYEICLERLGSNKDNTIVFEDAHYAIRTLKKAGFHVVAVHDPQMDAKVQEIKSLADVYIESFDQFPRF